MLIKKNTKPDILTFFQNGIATKLATVAENAVI
jgi:hypothetical protein